MKQTKQNKTNNQTQVSAHPLLFTLHDDDDDDDNDDNQANSPQQSPKTKQNKRRHSPTPGRLPEPFSSIRVSCFLCDWEYLF